MTTAADPSRPYRWEQERDSMISLSMDKGGSTAQRGRRGNRRLASPPSKDLTSRILWLRRCRALKLPRSDETSAGQAAYARVVIVVGIDGSPAGDLALQTALQLAGDDETLLVVTAWQGLRGDFGLPYERLIHPSSADIEREWAERTSSEAADNAKAAGQQAEGIAAHGKPGKVLCSLARERDARLLVVGSSGWGAVEGIVMGSVSAAVLHSAPCAVVVVRPPAGPRSQATTAPAG